MSEIWYTSDLHLQHKFVAGLRGFATPDAHDDEIVHRWNSLVSPRDHVWVLGDVTLGKIEAVKETITKLNGVLHLVSGNHDAVWSGHRNAHKGQKEWLKVFDTIQPFARHRIARQNVLLSHFPYTADHTPDSRYDQYRLKDEGLFLLHGHLHSAEKLTSPREIHVGLDAWGLKPVSQYEIEGIIEKITKWKSL